MKYRCYTKNFPGSLEDRPLLWSNMADPIWPILEVFSHFLNFDLHFFPNGGTSQNSAYAEAKYKCYSKTFHTSLEDRPLLWSNMADPIWPILEVFSQFLNFDLHFFQMVEQAKILPMQKRNINAIPKLFVLHLRTDFCCGQIWRIQYGRYWKFSVNF